MEWPDKLLEMFNDPIFDDVHPKAKAISPNDRMAIKLEEINSWIDKNNREPSCNGNLNEKLLSRSLQHLRNGNDTDKEHLRQYDRLKLL